MNRADPDLDPPYPFLDQYPLLVDNNIDNGRNNNNTVDIDEDEDDGDVAGPTVEAHVDLAKTARKHCMILYY
jgi:hypothetical protein